MRQWKRARTLLLASIAGAAVPAAGCVLSDENERARPESGSGHVSEALTPHASTPEKVTDRTLFVADLASPTTVVDRRGRRWSGRPLTAKPTPTSTPIRLSKAGHFYGGSITKTMRAMSPREYAEAMSPVRLVVDEEGNMAEYVSDVLPTDVDRYASALAKERAGTRMRFIDGIEQEWSEQEAAPPLPTSRRSTPATFADLLDTVTPRAVFPTDGRLWATPAETLGGPGAQAVVFSITNGGYGSGTLIGTATAMSMAHVFYCHSDCPPQQAGYGSPRSWSAGHVHRKLPSDPYFTHTSWCTRRPGGCPGGSAWVYGGYIVNFPSGWLRGGIYDWEWDIAVFDTYGAYAPGTSAGPFGAGYGAGPADYESGLQRQWAYDAADPLPPSSQGGFVYAPPSLLKRSSGISGSLTQPSPIRQPWLIGSRYPNSPDMTAACSGSGVLAQIFRNVGDHTYYWTGSWGGYGRVKDNSGNYIGPNNCGSFSAVNPPSHCWNLARRLDAPTWQWIKWAANEFVGGYNPWP